MQNTNNILGTSTCSSILNFSFSWGGGGTHIWPIPGWRGIHIWQNVRYSDISSHKTQNHPQHPIMIFEHSFVGGGGVCYLCQGRGRGHRNQTRNISCFSNPSNQITICFCNPHPIPWNWNFCDCPLLSVNPPGINNDHPLRAVLLSQTQYVRTVHANIHVFHQMS